MTTNEYTGPVTVDIIGSGRVTVQRLNGIYAWEAEGARRVNDIAGSQILALVLGGMALERMEREAEKLATEGNETGPGANSPPTAGPPPTTRGRRGFKRSGAPSSYTR